MANNRLPKTPERERARLRRQIRLEVKRTDTAFGEHIRKSNGSCDTDSGGCTVRAKYQERLATLQFVNMLLGGRSIDDETTIEELQYKRNGR